MEKWKKKRNLLILLAVLVVVVLVILNQWGADPKTVNKQWTVNEKDALQTELYINKYLETKEGLIRTDFKGNPNGGLILSESMGLWLDYLGFKGDQVSFDATLQAIDKQMLSEEKLLYWKIENGSPAETNALIDDLRLIATLFRQGGQTNRADYIVLAKEMSQAIVTYNREQGQFVDFYDTKHGVRNKELTLSYMIPEAFEYMVTYDVMTAKEYEQLRRFMQETPYEDGFYPKEYSLTDATYRFEDEINLIDQLYVATHLEGFEISTEPFFQWLQDTFYEENRLHGRYDRITKQETVAYESVAVYALAILYGLEKGEQEFVNDIYKRMIELRIDDPASPYHGGYLDGDATHSFDNLLALLAERRLLDEGHRHTK